MKRPFWNKCVNNNKSLAKLQKEMFMTNVISTYTINFVLCHDETLRLLNSANKFGLLRF
jgi:hypothetical protein